MSSADQGMPSAFARWVQQPKTQRLLIVGGAIVALHIAQEVFAATSAKAAFVANALQIVSALIAAGFCFGALRRGKGFTKAFWLLICLSLVVWTAADLGWLYYEAFLRMSPARDSIVHFLVDARSLFLAMALLLDQNEEVPAYYFDARSVLDTIQLFIIFLLIYLGWYQVPTLHESRVLSMLRSDEIEIGENIAVLGLALLQVMRASTRQLRELYVAFLACCGPLVVGILLTDYRELKTAAEVKTGTWLDLWWTIPFLMTALWASGWKQDSNFFPMSTRKQSFPSLLFENTIYSAGPMIVLLQACELGPGWRKLSLSLVAISILCFGLRLALSKFRETSAATSLCEAHEALLLGEGRLRLFVEHSPAAIAVFDREMRYIQASRRWIEDYGLSGRDIYGQSQYDLFPEIPAHWKEAHRRGLAGEILREDGERFERADGTVHWVRWEIRPWHETNGRIGGIAIFAEEIGARKRAEEKLRESEDRYRDLVEHTEDLVCTHDLEGNLISVNPASARILGMEPEELLRTPMKELLVPEWRDEFDGYLERIRRNRTDHGLLCVRTRGGERRLWAYRNTLRTEGVPKPIIRGMAHDVTERKRAESALRSSERRYRLLFERAVSGVGIISLAGQVLDCNDAWARMFGYQQASECRNRSIVGHYRDAEQRKSLLAELEKTGVFLNREWELQKKDGTPLWVLLNSILLRDGGGEPVIQSTMIDITERKHAEEALRHSVERFRVALKDSPISVFNQDRELRYTWIYNPQLYLDQDVIGKTDGELLGAKKASALCELKRRVLNSGKAVREEVSISLNGSRYVFDISVEPLFDNKSEVVGITGACVDVARLREMADRLQESTDRLTREKSYLESEIQAELGFEEIIGQSAALREVLKKAKVVAPLDSSVLLLGETGTGKELVARSVHALSTRRDKTFVKLNCAAVPSGLLESELFGHEKGAFTGAVNQKIGRIELADKGTLFLDEIGELPLELQPKLLRVLQDREFERLGAVKTLHVDVRIISATNRDLRQDIADKKFREDLFYRLNVFPIELPALRERRDDIPALVQHFLYKHAAKMRKQIDEVPDEVMDTLCRWDWPGNVRELENMIERMVILSRGCVLAAPPAEIQEATPMPEDDLAEMERDHIIRVLRETNGVLSGEQGAANRLGLKRTTLQSMMKRLGIEAQDYRGLGNGTSGDL